MRKNIIIIILASLVILGSGYVNFRNSSTFNEIDYFFSIVLIFPIIILIEQIIIIKKNKNNKLINVSNVLSIIGLIIYLLVYPTTLLICKVLYKDCDIGAVVFPILGFLFSSLLTLLGAIFSAIGLLKKN